MKRCTRFLLVALLILGVGVPTARAAALSGRASTQALWFSDEFGADHFDLAQYARFHARNFDAANTVQVSGYGRAWGDVQQGGGVEGRLYYLYLDKKGLPGQTDVRVGRQFFFVSAGSAIVDGARVDSRPFGPLAITAVGGRHVKFDVTGEETRSGDIAAAVQASLTNIPQGSLDLSYFVSYDENDLAREGLGLAASKRFDKYGELYTQLRFDLLSEVWSEIQFGARTAILPKWTFNAEFFRTVPVFDASSIFAVFAVERFQEILLRAQYDLGKRISLNGEYRNESFGGGDTANVGELGVRYRPADGMSLYGAGIWRVGTGGNLAGFELSGDKVVLQKYILAAGVQHDSFRRELSNSYDSATRFWIGGEAKVRKNLSVQARVEDTVSQRFSKDIRARLALNVDF
ncbi:MAG: hypothetical protein HZA60_02510 [Deltaproteobacteria bacterium]|nr:hypothetical protein [Deltaproteobacteria bacterium]